MSAELVDFADKLNRGGIDLVSTSASAEEAVLVKGGEAVVVRPPRVDVKSTVGAGDALISGLIH